MIWIHTVCKGRIYPGSAGLGLRLLLFINILTKVERDLFLWTSVVFTPRFSYVFGQTVAWANDTDPDQMLQNSFHHNLHCLSFIEQVSDTSTGSFFFFVFFFDLGFTALSRIFHLYRADRSSKVGENRRTWRKTTWPSVSRTWLSHIWPERGSNHSGEKPNGLRVNSLIH